MLDPRLGVLRLRLGRPGFRFGAVFPAGVDGSGAAMFDTFGCFVNGRS